MPRGTFDIGTLSTVFCLGAASCLAVGCYRIPRTTFPDAGGGGSGGASWGQPSDASDGTSDNIPIVCPATCPGPTTGSTTGAGACVDGACRISCNATYPTLCAASNACVDLTSDAKNCGTCGHDCLGGVCADGQCQPVMIAQYLGNPMAMYVGAQAVYVSTDLGYVGRARKDGSDLKPFAMPGFASSAYIGTLLTEDSDRVFLVRYNGTAIQLSYCMTSGCDATATLIGGEYTQYFAVDQTNHRIVWVDYTPTRFVSASTVGTISGVDLPGGALSSSNVRRLFYTQGGVYFADGNGVNRIPVAGGSLVSVTSGAAPLTILSANSTSLFVYDGSAIGSVPLPSGDVGGPKPLIATNLNPGIDGNFAVDDGSMYWPINGVANTCQISDCAGTQRTLPKRDVDSIWDVGIDSGAIYSFAGGAQYNNTAASTVWKVAK